MNYIITSERYGVTQLNSSLASKNFKNPFDTSVAPKVPQAAFSYFSVRRSTPSRVIFTGFIKSFSSK